MTKGEERGIAFTVRIVRVRAALLELLGSGDSDRETPSEKNWLRDLASLTHGIHGYRRKSHG